MNAPTYTEWKNVLTSNPNRDQTAWLISWVGQEKMINGASRRHLWDALIESDVTWDKDSLMKLALECEGPPSSEGWVWLLEQKGDAHLEILRRWGWLLLSHGGKFYHAGRFARKAGRAFSADSNPAKVLAFTDSLMLEQAGSVSKELYNQRFTELFPEKSAQGEVNEY